MPRSDGIALGSTMERGEWSLEPNEEARRRNVDGAVAVFRAMRGLRPELPVARSLAPARPPAVDTVFEQQTDESR
jgi:hypothetical protein